MKKIIIALIIISVFLGWNLKVTAASSESINWLSVDINYPETWYLRVNKSSTFDTVTFDVDNIILEGFPDISSLRSILMANFGEISEPLTFFEPINIKINPEPESAFHSLMGKDNFYLSNTGFKLVSNPNATLPKGLTAEVRKLDTNLFIETFIIEYRTLPFGEWQREVPDKNALLNKTIGEQLSIVLGIATDELYEEIMNQYEILYQFVPINNVTFKNRLDFYDEKIGTSPVIVKTIPENRYAVESLNYLGTKYVIVNYNKIESVFYQTDISQAPDNNKILTIIMPLIFIGIVSGIGYLIYYLKYTKKYIVNK